MAKIWKIFEPLSYLRIKNSHLKQFSFYIPAFLTIIFIAMYLLLPIKLNIFNENGLIKSISNFLSLLIGFYIASLAAIATFQNENLDKKIQGEKAILEHIRGGQELSEELTRRRFLCLLFGYCSLASIFLFLLGIFSQLLQDNLREIIPNIYHSFFIVLFLVVYIFVFFNLIVTTLLGLNYLTDRIHRS